jgi:hypothetical protein
LIWPNRGWNPQFTILKRACNHYTTDVAFEYLMISNMINSLKFIERFGSIVQISLIKLSCYYFLRFSSKNIASFNFLLLLLETGHTSLVDSDSISFSECYKNVDIKFSVHDAFQSFCNNFYQVQDWRVK